MMSLLLHVQCIYHTSVSVVSQITVEEQTHTERGGANEEEREEKKDEDSEDDDDW